MNKVNLTQNVSPRTSEVVRENDVWPRFLRGVSIASTNNLPPERAFLVKVSTNPFSKKRTVFINQAFYTKTAMRERLNDLFPSNKVSG